MNGNAPNPISPNLTVNTTVMNHPDSHETTLNQANETAKASSGILDESTNEFFQNKSVIIPAPTTGGVATSNTNDAQPTNASATIVEDSQTQSADVSTTIIAADSDENSEDEEEDGSLRVSVIETTAMLLLPFLSALIGKLLFPMVRPPLMRSLCGAALVCVVRDGIMTLDFFQLRLSRKTRRVLNYP
jgi:hypothetical protein